MLKQIAHRWLHIPYSLNVHVNRRPKKPVATIVFIHGIGHSGAAWDEVVAKLPDNLHVISIDLLGFGKSPKPTWAVYDAKTQTRSVLATFLKLRIKGPVIFAGHSLGALVAVEIAKRYPILVDSLVLFSPPFYRANDSPRKFIPSADKMRREIYYLIKNRPEQLIRIASLAIKLGLLNKSFSLTEKDAPIYMNAFEASILNQTSLEDAIHLHRIPIHIVYGRLDPVIRSRNLRYLARMNQNVQLRPVLASHEIVGPFVDVAVKTIHQIIAVKSRASDKSSSML